MSNISEADLYKSNIIYFYKVAIGEANYRKAINVTSSSDQNSGVNNQGLVGCIFDTSVTRWVSKIESNAYFTIDFLSGEVYVQSYLLKWSASSRYNKAWTVKGYRYSKWTNIDTRNEANLCPKTSTACTCPTSHFTIFPLKNPGFYTKLRFTANGADSCGANIFSLTQIMLFGKKHTTNKIKPWLLTNIFLTKNICIIFLIKIIQCLT